jgi:mannose-6-phosphate isomerase-like protein (cupin superfamily)
MSDLYKIDIDKLTDKNDAYRRVVWTTKQAQLVVMSIPKGDDIHFEVHPKTTQFIKIEKGQGFGDIEGQRYNLKDGESLFIPAGIHHYIKNTGKTSLKLYTIYSPPEHPENLVEETNPDK